MDAGVAVAGAVVGTAVGGTVVADGTAVGAPDAGASVGYCAGASVGYGAGAHATERMRTSMMAIMPKYSRAFIIFS